MKAAVVTVYGSPDGVHIEDVPKPVPREGEVLIRVGAASVNPLDWHLMHGTPLVSRLVMGLRRPRVTRPGVDVAATVEATGRNVTQFKAGDEVFGGCRGAFAEYVCTPATKLARKPADITFEQAAALPVAGLTALQALRDKAHVQPGHHVLINGASGGVGTFSVQIAKIFGARVTAVCSARNADLVRSLGADHVIDYTHEDFTTSTLRYDVLFDLVANHSLSACRRVLTPNGRYVCAGVLGTSMLTLPARLLASAALSPFVSQKFTTMFARQNQPDLDTLAELMREGKLVAVIDRCFPLNDIAEAIRCVAQKHARGKVVVTISSPAPDA